MYERTIFELQGKGYTVIIAHPERYLAVQEDVEVARELVRMGCKLQASADFVAGGRMARNESRQRSCSRRTCTATLQATRIEWSITTASLRRGGHTDAEERMRVCESERWVG